MAFAQASANRWDMRPAAAGSRVLRAWQWWLPLLLLLCGAACLRAAPSGPPLDPASGLVPVDGRALAGGLLVVGGLLAALPLVMKRVGAGVRGRGSIEVAESRSLGGKRALLIVKVEGRRLLLGAGDHGVNLLADLGAAAAAAPARTPFAETLDAELRESSA